MTSSHELSSVLKHQNLTSQGALLIQDAFTQESNRHGIIDSDFLNTMSEVLLKKTGDGSDIIWYETGKKWGEIYYESISSHCERDSQDTDLRPQDFLKDDVIENLNTNFSYMGIGQFRLIEGNKYYVIELKNPFFLSPSLTAQDNLIVMMAGFFAVWFSRFSEKTLECIPFNPGDQPDVLRFAISTETVIGELLNLVMQKKPFAEIAELYHNQHML